MNCARDHHRDCSNSRAPSSISRLERARRFYNRSQYLISAISLGRFVFDTIAHLPLGIDCGNAKMSSTQVGG
jgi:hypothetical protein